MIVHLQDSLEEANMHLLSPLSYMHGLYSNMLDKVYHRVSVSWSFYMQNDNGNVIIIQSQPQFLEYDGHPDDNPESSEEGMSI